MMPVKGSVNHQATDKSADKTKQDRRERIGRPEGKPPTNEQTDNGKSNACQ
jgi:hypothetical protein